LIRRPFEPGIMALTQCTVNVVVPGIYRYVIGNLATAER
jgi:hypothetical protein